MKKRSLLPVLLSAAAILFGAFAAQGKEEDKNLRGTIATKEEQKGAEEYFDSLFGSDKLPFSFSIGDRHFDSFTEDFTVKQYNQVTTDFRPEYCILFGTIHNGIFPCITTELKDNVRNYEHKQALCL